MTPPWDSGPEVKRSHCQTGKWSFCSKTAFFDGGIIVRALFQAAVSTYRYGIGNSPDATKF